MTGRELQFGEQEIVDQGDGYVVYEAEGGEQFQIQVPKGWSPESNAMYKAVEKDGVFVLEADGAKAAVAGAAGGASAGLMEMLKRARGAAESDRFGEPDMPGQRSDNFEQGGRTYAGQYMGEVKEDEGGLYGEYETDSGEVIKAYFPSEYYPGDVGSSDYIKDRDFALVEQDGKKMWVPTSYGAGEENIGKAVMRESTQGASKVENLLERLSDVKRRSMGGKSYRYQ